MHQEQDWLLQKARFILELAQINAHWSKDYSASIALLEEADALLRPLNLSKILEIRQAIAKEITELKSKPGIDVTGLLSRLDAAQTSVANLAMQYRLDKQEPKAQAPQTKDWQVHLKNNLSALEKLVVIRRDDEEVKRFMSPLYKSIIKETILLNLQEAQWAVINHETTVYQLALKQAIQHIQKTADEQDPQTLALIKQLSELQQVQLTWSKPDIGLAIPLLNQLIESKQSIMNPKKGEKQP